MSFHCVFLFRTLILRDLIRKRTYARAWEMKMTIFKEIIFHSKHLNQITMVGFTRILNSGLLLLPYGVFEDVATPQQASIEQYNIIKYLGGSGPYLQRPGYGISTDLNDNQCNVEQIQMISRHGERFPSLGDGKFFNEILDFFKNYNNEFKGDLEFLNNYKFFMNDMEDNYEKLTADGVFSGKDNMLRHGKYFRKRYSSLFDKNDKLIIFTSNSGRCYHSGEYFAKGFLGDEYNQNKVEFVIIEEDERMGGNSLTPRYSCKSFNQNINNDLIEKYDKSYLQQILTRLTKDNPGLELTTSHIQGLFLWIAFEINVKGYSPFSHIFSIDEYIKDGYRNDIVNYYKTGPGHNLTTVIGSPMVEAFLKILQDKQKKITLTFTHDTDMEIYLSSMGLIIPKNDIPVDYIPFPNPYNAAELFPQSSRIYTEKLKCGNDYFIRFIINDSVYPYPGCNMGPGFSCEINTFIKLVKSRLENIDFKKQCQIDKTPSELTFYWDYNTTKYDAPLIDQ